MLLAIVTSDYCARLLRTITVIDVVLMFASETSAEFKERARNSKARMIYFHVITVNIAKLSLN